MARGGVSLRKIAKMEVLAFKNVLRLHFDSILLFKKKSYPSSYFLSAIALEEFGKVHMLNNYVWGVRANGLPNEDEYARAWLKAIYSHRSKQWNYVRHALCFPSRNVVPESGVIDRFDLEKQHALYVGLRRKGRQVDIRGRIVSPFKIKKHHARRQITIVNDELIRLTCEILTDHGDWDTYEVEPLFNKRLLNRLTTSWFSVGRLANGRLKLMNKKIK